MTEKIRVAIAGLGNCASALIQGVYYYKDARDDDFVPGLMHVRFGDYHIRDIEFVAAFEVDARKIGLDLSEAIFAGNNAVPKFADVPRLGVKVLPGPILDGVAPHMTEAFSPYDPNETEPVNVADVLDTKLVIARKSPDIGIKSYYETSFIATDPPTVVNLFMPTNALNINDRVLIVDDLLRTGKTSSALMRLVKMSGATPVGVFSILAVGDKWKAALENEVEKIYIVKHLPG